jgi:threonine/homoserine efflux transporter RhtA
MSQHEHAPLTRREETELARIGQRLHRDGIRLDRALARREWPYQLVGVTCAALGGMMAASAVVAGDRIVLLVEAIAGGVLVVVAALVAVSPVRRWIVRSASLLHWRLSGTPEAPAMRCRRRLSALRARRRH